MFTAVVALLYINIGNMARLSVGVAAAKHEAQEKLANDASHLTLTITQQQIDLGEAAFINNHELKWKGERYDIASLLHSGNTYTLKVVHDEKEEGLLSELREEVEQWFNTTTDKAPSKPTVKHQDILKDFIPSRKMVFTLSSSAHSYAYMAVHTPQSPMQLVIKGPPKHA